MSRDIRNANDPGANTGDGSARGAGKGAGGLGSGGDRAQHGKIGQTADPWDAPGVAPDGHRTGSSTDGPRIAMDGEAEPDPDRFADEDESPDG